MKNKIDESKTVWQKVMTNPIYYIERSLRIRRFIMNCMPVFVLVELFVIFLVVSGLGLLK